MNSLYSSKYRNQTFIQNEYLNESGSYVMGIRQYEGIQRISNAKE